MQQILEEIKAQYAYARGLFGRGICVAVLDTGVSMHADLQERVVQFTDYIGNRRGAYDDNGHGTHISGIIAANGRSKQHGVAPACSIFAVKVLNRNGNGKIADICRAIEDLIAQNRRLRPPVRILNISVGMTETTHPDRQKQLLAAVEEAWDRGIVVVAAAGNNGPKEHSITSPGISRKIITVGSIDDGWNPERGKGYSGRGPTDECVVKPEILMPGTNILSCSNKGNGYVRKSGTSMAAPVLTGMIAILLNAYPSLTPNEVKMRLFYSALEVKGSGSRSWGTVTMDRLL